MRRMRMSSKRGQLTVVAGFAVLLTALVSAIYAAGNPSGAGTGVTVTSTSKPKTQGGVVRTEVKYTVKVDSDTLEITELNVD